MVWARAWNARNVLHGQQRDERELKDPPLIRIAQRGPMRQRVSTTYCMGGDEPRAFGTCPRLTGVMPCPAAVSVLTRTSHNNRDVVAPAKILLCWGLLVTPTSKIVKITDHWSPDLEDHEIEDDDGMSGLGDCAAFRMKEEEKARAGQAALARAPR